jgi:hypothetical protein
MRQHRLLGARLEAGLASSSSSLFSDISPGFFGAPASRDGEPDAKKQRLSHEELAGAAEAAAIAAAAYAASAGEGAPPGVVEGAPAFGHAPTSRAKEKHSATEKRRRDRIAEGCACLLVCMHACKTLLRQHCKQRCSACAHFARVLSSLTSIIALPESPGARPEAGRLTDCAMRLRDSWPRL